MVFSFLKKNWFGVITAFLSFIILIAAIFITGEKDVFILAIKNADKLWILISIVFILIYWTMDAVTLNVLTRPMYKGYKFWESFKNGMIGLLYSALTPFSAGSEPMQIYEMVRTGIKTGDACSIITIKSIIYQGGMITYGIASAIMAWKFFNNSVASFPLLLLYGIITNFIFMGSIIFICVKKDLTKKIVKVCINALAKIKIIKNTEKILKKCNEQIDVFYNSVKALKNEGKAIFQCVLVTFFQLTLFYAIPFCVYRGFHLNEASLYYMIAANALISMITSFVPIPGAAGAAEISFHSFFALFFSPSLLLSAILIWRAVTYYSCIVAGGVISLMLIYDDRRNVSNANRLV